MRHELFGTNLQVLHFIEHGIEDDVLDAGADDLLNLFDAFITASPNTDTGAEIGILITQPEPLAQTTLGAVLVVIDGEIDAFGDPEGGRIALRLCQELSDHGRLTNERR